MHAIVADRVSRQYAPGRGVRDVSLRLDAGQCLGILGPNGSGKSTLTRLMAGIERTDDGALTVFDAPAHERPAELRRRCGVALDTPATWKALSGRQHLEFFARQYGLRGRELHARTALFLDEASLASQADDPVRDYSFGMRRKLHVLTALCHEPDLLILDEPTAGADAAFVSWLATHIGQRGSQGKATWVADNDPDWLSRAATHALLLESGRVAAHGTVSELNASVGARSEVTVVFDGEPPAATPDMPGVVGTTADGNHLTVTLDGDASRLGDLVNWMTGHGAKVRSVEVRAVTLREALAQRSRKGGRRR